jgi:hypothetical protein
VRKIKQAQNTDVQVMATDTSSASSGKRPWLAALLAFVYPGLGHVYLRLWGRALLWFVFVVASTMLLIPADTFPSTLSLTAMQEALQTIPLAVTLTVLGLTVLNVVDAYLMARRLGRGEVGGGIPGFGGDSEPTAGVTATTEDGEQTCPNCGREVDADLDFCHWCTTELGDSEE